MPDIFILTLWLVLIKINIFRNASTVSRSRNQPGRKLTRPSLAHPLWLQRNFLVIFCNLKLYFLDHSLQGTNSSGVLGGRAIKDLVNRNKPMLRYRCFLIKSPDPLFNRPSSYHIHFHFWKLTDIAWSLVYIDCIYILGIQSLTYNYHCISLYHTVHNISTDRTVPHFSSLYQ